MLSRNMKIMGFRIFFLYLMLLTGTLLSAQNRYTIAGEITDAESGEELVGATVYVAETSLGSYSNSNGYYSLTVPGGNQVLVCSYYGYEEFHKEIRLVRDQHLNISLTPASTESEEVAVEAEVSDRKQKALK